MQQLVDLLTRISPQGPEARFLLAAVVVVIAGSRLSRYGDIFSEKLGLGRAFVGLIFMAFATALPELITSLSSAIAEDAPNLALGNNFGSIMFNVSILAGLELLLVGTSLFARVHREVVAPGIFSIAMIAIGAGSLVVEMRGLALTPTLWSIGLSSGLIFTVYAGGTWFLQRHHAKILLDETEENAEERKGASLGGAVAKYLLTVLAIAWAGVNLARAGDDFTAKYSLSHSFVGTIFLAIVTSLPELSATVGMVRRGMYEMAFGNIFGSNAFNVVVLATVDVFYRKDCLFRAAAVEGTAPVVHLITSSIAIIMTLIVLYAVIRKPGKLARSAEAAAPPSSLSGRLGRDIKGLPGNILARLSWPALLVIAAFLTGAWLAYVAGRA